jgi:hypothetical protein
MLPGCDEEDRTATLKDSAVEKYSEFLGPWLYFRAHVAGLFRHLGKKYPAP